MSLGPKPVRLLYLLASRPGELVDREEIYDLLWPDRRADANRGTNTCIRQIRMALGDRLGPSSLIQTYPGGYRFRSPILNRPGSADAPTPRPPVCRRPPPPMTRELFGAAPRERAAFIAMSSASKIGLHLRDWVPSGQGSPAARAEAEQNLVPRFDR